MPTAGDLNRRSSVTGDPQLLSLACELFLCCLSEPHGENCSQRIPMRAQAGLAVHCQVSSTINVYYDEPYDEQVDC